MRILVHPKPYYIHVSFKKRKLSKIWKFTDVLYGNEIADLTQVFRKLYPSISIKSTAAEFSENQLYYIMLQFLDPAEEAEFIMSMSVGDV